MRTLRAVENTCNLPVNQRTGSCVLQHGASQKRREPQRRPSWPSAPHPACSPDPWP